MAKTTRTGKNKTAPAQSKSASIREYLAKNPKANPIRIVEDLKAKGIDVSLGLANVVKYSSGKQTGRRKKLVRRRVGRPAGSSNGAGALTLENLLETKQLVRQLGGADKVRRALDLLEQLA